MSQTFFTDGVGNLSMMNGMVRVQFMTAVPSDGNAQGSASYAPAFSAVLTPQGFLQSYKKMQALVQKMVEAGVLLKQGEERRTGPARDTSVSAVVGDVVKPVAKKTTTAKTSRGAKGKKKA